MTQKRHLGLSLEEVENSRKKFGSNSLTPPKKQSIWHLLAEKFKDPIVIILCVALAASVGISIYHYFGEGASAHVFLEPLGIAIAVILSTSIGFAFEVSANRKFEALNQMNESTIVKVIRNGKPTEVTKNDLVVGDIILLNTGDEIPADAQLLESVSMQVNESTLTGEPVMRKTIIESEFDEEATYPSNMVYRGCTVVEGSATAEVVTVGDNTEYGKVYLGAQVDNKLDTPLQIQLHKLAKLISYVSFAVALIIIIGRTAMMFTGNHYDDLSEIAQYLLNTLMMAITVVIVAVPEGLPMSVTLSLAMSMKKMLATNNLVRKLHACETMGATTVICTDKTGTLTQNQMRVAEMNMLGGENGHLKDKTIDQIIRLGMAVNSTAHLDISDQGVRTLGNPTEAAILLWMHDNNIDYSELRNSAKMESQIPFSTERKYMASVVRATNNGARILFVKGAPEIVFNLSTHVLLQEGETPTTQYKETLTQTLVGYQSKAMRTLGFAYSILNDNEEPILDNKLTTNKLTFTTVVAIADPVRADVPDAIQDCLNAGIGVKIVTGDTPITAKEIGRQIGLWQEGDQEDQIITGPEFEALSDETLRERIMDLKIIARARPMDKKRLVETLQEMNQVVAVTGDGTNDAPALKAAQVGLSMGDGTQVAKEASAITILDNSFSSIVKAVLWGRSLYQNIQRFILFQLTINLSACIIVLFGAFMGTEPPLTITQILWVNLIMDTFAALALATLPPNESVMKDKPRKSSDYILSKSMKGRIIATGSIFTIIMLLLVQYFYNHEITSLDAWNWGDFWNSAINFQTIGNHLSSYELTIIFTTFVLMQFWNLFNAKGYLSSLGLVGVFKMDAKGFFIAQAVILFGQWVIVTFGGEMFSTVPLNASEWLTLFLATAPIVILGQIMRVGNNKRKMSV